MEFKKFEISDYELLCSFLIELNKEDKTHINWEFVSTSGTRIANYNKSTEYHKIWLNEVLNMSDRVLVMHEGKITANLSKDEMSQEVIMRYATGGGTKNVA